MKISISFDFGKKETFRFVEELRGAATTLFNNLPREAYQSPPPGPTAARSAPLAEEDTCTTRPEEPQEEEDLGETAFAAFIAAWRYGLDASFLPVDGVEQPDRGDLLKRLHNHPNVVDVLKHINACGSLQRAVFRACSDLLADDAVVLTNTIVSPASILFPDLYATYDWRQNPFKNKK